ncbi:MAG TPA: redoxin domain-containing protein [Vicinamibacterales bacterium]|nr:redoxin domain-containing protein [Vicinamibacterales bacterium]
MPKLLAAVLLTLAATAPVRVVDLENRAVDPFQITAGAKAAVFLFTATDCPISNRYAPEIQRLHQAYGNQGVRFFLVYPNPADTPELIREHAKAFGYPADALLRDPKQALAKAAKVTIAPEAAVFVQGRLVYHGRIDDRFVDFGLDRPEPTVRDLDEAIAAVVAGKPVPHPVTQAVGCYIADYAR